MPAFEQARAANGRPLFAYSVLTPASSRSAEVEPPDAVVDGDTLRGLFGDAQSLRFLGCDTPETSLRLPRDVTARARETGEDPFRLLLAERAPDGPTPLPRLVFDAIGPRLAGDPGANHLRHGQAAAAALRAFVAGDAAALADTGRPFRFFAAYAHEILDGYARPLAFLNADAERGRRPRLTYNARMIAAGLAAAYFIWPNIDPFRGRPSVGDAAMPPGELRRAVTGARAMAEARAGAAAARTGGLGIHAPSEPLLLDAFELRFLRDRRAPSRWLIDLAAAEDDPTLLPPEAYPLVPNAEDRLFVPEEYVPLFAARGWRPAMIVLR
jgi:hypothetical protein